MKTIKKAVFIPALCLIASSGWILNESDAQAAGLYLSNRGVRPLGRGGAFIAGADDAGAIAYNPAGLFDAGGQFLMDGSWVNFSSDYTRQSLVRQVDPNTGEQVGSYVQTYAPVQGSTPFLPIPTIAASYKLNPEWVLGAGVWAPYAALSSYPDTVSGQPAPQRYSLLSLDGSALALVGVGAAYAPMPNLRLGATLGILTGIFRSTVVFSGCVPERFFCAPEDPDYDVLAELNAGPIIAPTGQLGAIYKAHPKVTIGASFQLPIFVRSGATIRTRLPASPVFETARQEGEEADIDFELPYSIQLGVEVKPIENVRVEFAGSFDGWGMHDTIEVDPDGVALKNVAAFPENYYLPNVTLARGFQNSFSLRLGGEYGFSLAGKQMFARAGLSFDSSAVPKEYLSVLTMDANKVTPSIGFGAEIGPIRLDAVFAYVIMPQVTVDPATAKIQQVSPVQANPPAFPTIVNGGIYNGGATIIGLGAAYTFDPAGVAGAP